NRPLGPPGPGPRPERPATQSSEGLHHRSHVLDVISELSPRYQTMTQKELVVQAILDNFKNGGTAAEIRDFIRDAYGIVIAPSSLRPQMHRLKADGVLTHDPSTDTWNLVPDKRVGYALYDHPTSRAAM